MHHYKRLDLTVEMIDEAEWISLAAYRSMIAAEKATLYWEASQDLHKCLPEPTNE